MFNIFNISVNSITKEEKKTYRQARIVAYKIKFFGKQ